MTGATREAHRPAVRDRITHGLNRARLRVEMRRARLPIVIIAIGILASLGAWLVIFKNVGKYVYADNREVGVEVADATGLVGGGRQEVRFKGIPAGVVDVIETRHGKPFIKVKVYRRFLPVYRDARLALRPTTALEDMYFDILDRGSPAAGEASLSRPIPARRVKTGVQVEEVLQALDPDVRRHLASLLGELGDGISGRGASLRRAFAEVVPFLHAANRLTRQLSWRGRATRRLIHNTAAITTELGRRDRALRSLVTEAGGTLRSLQSGSRDLDATLRAIPRTLSDADASFASVRAALPDVTDALVALRPVADRLPAGLSALRSLSGDARPALTLLHPSVVRLSSLSRQLAPASRRLDQAVTQLLPQIPAIDHATRTTAGCSTALQGFFQWTPSVMKLGDARGAVVRGQAVVGLASSAAVKDPVVHAQDSCAPGGPVGGTPGAAGSLEQESER